MAWMRQACGRLESRYSYSNSWVYNNYPWPENVSEKPQAAVEAAAQKVLAVRAEFLSEGARPSGRFIVKPLWRPNPKLALIQLGS